MNADGHREILGVDVVSAEDGAGWLAFLRGLVARGLSGVKMVTSDCHAGLRDAIASTLPGASWQRCRAHYRRNLLTRVAKSAQPWVSTLVRTIFEQPSAEAVHARHRQVVLALEAKFPAAAEHQAQRVTFLLWIWGQLRERRAASAELLDVVVERADRMETPTSQHCS